MRRMKAKILIMTTVTMMTMMMMTMITMTTMMVMTGVGVDGWMDA